MARQLRLEYPGAIYHINTRGNHREYIFKDDDDRGLFLRLLRSSIERADQIMGVRAFWHTLCSYLG